jgi:preprotein translocase subunit SecG
METFIAILHIFVALILIVLVLIQDSKSGSVGAAFGGGGSNSVFGATGATTLAQKLTRYTAVLFAGTCIALTMYASKAHKSVLDSLGAGVATPPAQTAPAAGTPEAGAPSTPSPETGTATPEAKP